MTEDEMVEWHHRLDGHEFEQAPGVGDGQGSLACCSPWGRKESDTTEQLTLNLVLCRLHMAPWGLIPYPDVPCALTCTMIYQVLKVKNTIHVGPAFSGH